MLSLPLVSIIIVNYNGREFLYDCITSTLRQDYDPFEVILVDNASSDMSVAFVEEHFPAVCVIEAGSNLGFAGGNNLGVQHARGPFIVLLNNDTTVEPGWLQALVEAVVPEYVGVASSLVRTEGIPDRYYEKNGTINFVGQNIMRAFDEPTDIFYAGGTSLIYKKELLGPPFDPDYFAYAEDVYLSLRVRFLGYQVKHTNALRVMHHGSSTARKQLPQVLTYYQERNRLLNIVLFFSLQTLLRIIPFFVANVMAKVLISVFSRRWSLLGLLRAYWWFLTNVRTIHEKRQVLRRQWKISEEHVITLMSGKLTNGESVPGRFLNMLSLAYCRLVGLKTIEFNRR